MKDKKEQIEKMAQAMCGFCTEDKRCVLKYSAPCSEVASQDCTYKGSAEELLCKGYGDIKQAKIDVLAELKCRYGLYYLSAFGVKERMLADILNPMIEELKK